jgi:DNA recombination protein RmuC
MDLSLILVLVLGVALGFALGWLAQKNKPAGLVSDAANPELERENARAGALLNDAEKRLVEAAQVFRQQREELVVKEKELSAQHVEIKNLREKLDMQKKEVEELQEKFTLTFENLANKILKSNSTEFAESNQKKLDQILNPLKEKIVSFEKQVQEKYLDETKERSKLLEKIDELTRLNQSIGVEAHNLTNALKGDNKAQGNWGELILESILEKSGLVRDREYTLQYSTENAEGKKIQPDVIVNLPDSKHIIIDAKVSLTAYQAYVNADDDLERDRYLKAHVLSVRSHIKQLSEKNYQSGKGVNSPDFVLLFMNLEPGFSAALKADNELYFFAQERQIVIVSPSTLLATLRTISSVWKHERQTQNAIEIARRSGALYDKFVGFIEDLQKIKRGIDTSRDAYEAALNKLQHGSGNLIRRVEHIRELGAKATKRIPGDVLTDNAEDQLIEEGK